MTEVRLPETSWLRSESLTQLVEALITDGVPPRLVGGAVRDALLGLPVSDVDLATPLTPNDVIARLEAHNIRAVPTGIAHGTVTAVIKGQNFEVTTLRRDVSTDGRRATVAFSTEWQQDAARRDFTINALYADPLTGEIFDYHQGLDDLATRTVRFIGDPMQRIAEDHLRILRFFRFYARFGSDSPDDAAIAACRAAVHSLKSLSRERITDELLKLLSLSTPLASITLMIENGVFGAFLPELTDSAATDLRRLIDREQQAFESPSALRRLAALIPIQAEQADKIAARLKLSTRQRKYLNLLTTPIAVTASNVRDIAYLYGMASARDLALLRGADVEWQQSLTLLDDWDIPLFPIKGGDLITLGLNPGPLVAATLQQIERQWIAQGFPDTAATLLLADQAVAEALSNKN